MNFLTIPYKRKYIIQGVNAPLQGRGFIFDHDLNKDFTPSSESEIDYDEYADYELLKIGIPDCNYTRLKRNQVCKEILHEDDNSSTEFLHNNLDLYKQKLLVSDFFGFQFRRFVYLQATELHFEIEKTIFFLAKSIRRHLNIFQEFPVIYPVLRMLVEQIYQESIQEKLIDLFTRNASIQFPKNLTFRPSHQLGVRVNSTKQNLSNKLFFSSRQHFYHQHPLMDMLMSVFQQL